MGGVCCNLCEQMAWIQSPKEPPTTPRLWLQICIYLSRTPSSRRPCPLQRKHTISRGHILSIENTFYIYHLRDGGTYLPAPGGAGFTVVTVEGPALPLPSSPPPTPTPLPLPIPLSAPRMRRLAVVVLQYK